MGERGREEEGGARARGNKENKIGRVTETDSPSGGIFGENKKEKKWGEKERERMKEFLIWEFWGSGGKRRTGEGEEEVLEPVLQRQVF